MELVESLRGRRLKAIEFEPEWFFVDALARGKQSQSVPVYELSETNRSYSSYQRKIGEVELGQTTLRCRLIDRIEELRPGCTLYDISREIYLFTGFNSHRRDERSHIVRRGSRRGVVRVPLPRPNSYNDGTRVEDFYPYNLGGEEHNAIITKENRRLIKMQDKDRILRNAADLLGKARLLVVRTPTLEECPELRKGIFGDEELSIASHVPRIGVKEVAEDLGIKLQRMPYSLITGIGVHWVEQRESLVPGTSGMSARYTMHAPKDFEDVEK
jgi:hypothetical protein